MFVAANLAFSGPGALPSEAFLAVVGEGVVGGRGCGW